MTTTVCESYRRIDDLNEIREITRRIERRINEERRSESRGAGRRE